MGIISTITKYKKLVLVMSVVAVVTIHSSASSFTLSDGLNTTSNCNGCTVGTISNNGGLVQNQGGITLGGGIVTNNGGLQPTTGTVHLDGGLVSGCTNCTVGGSTITLPGGIHPCTRNCGIVTPTPTITHCPFFGCIVPSRTPYPTPTRTIIVPTPTPTRSPLPTRNPPVIIPGVDLKVNGSDTSVTIPAGHSVVLSWNSIHTTNCVASGAWSGAKVLNGSEVVNNITGTRQYAITCIGFGKTAHDVVTVYVTNPTVTPTPTRTPPVVYPPVVDLRVNGEQGSIHVVNGSNVNLSWNSNYTTSCFASNDWNGQKSLNGSETQYNLQGPTKNYVITCYGNGGSASDSVTVYIDNGSYNQGQLYISKTVRDITTNSSEGEVAYARPGDTVEFTIRVRDNSNITTNNVRIFDSLPSGLSYIDGTLRVDYGSFNQQSLFQNGVWLSNLNPGQTSTITFQARVNNATWFGNGIVNVVNTANANADNASRVEDSATVQVNNQYATTDTNNQASIQKFGRNITAGQAEFNSNVSAKPNDTIEFLIKVHSLSNGVLNNVIVKDVLPNGFIYVANTTSINNQITTDNLTSSTGLNIGTLYPNQEATIRFSARVNGSSLFNTGITYLVNTAYIMSANGTDINTSAQLPISINNSYVLGNIGGISTGPEGALAIALAVSAMITGGFLFYAKSSFFKARALGGLMKMHGVQNLNLLGK